ncbi:MAG TPA: family 16 glycoside hydrolase, partial [Thermomicrobiales bacterium]|nr:family 16 glycoside hydrolase [Thermomicrobiales bacterium]
APAAGVANPYGRIHDTTNCYVVGPALFPTTGSPNPMLSSVALGRRTADLLTQSVLPKPAPQTADPGYRLLFDGTAVSFNRWVRVSPGVGNSFALIDGEIITYGNGDFGLLYYGAEAFADFTLQVEFRVVDAAANSGVFVRCRDPLRDLPAAILARIQNKANQFNITELTDWQHYVGDVGRPANRAWSAVHSGFEIQIDDRAKGDIRRGYYGMQEPDGLRKNRTGAIYKIPAGDPIPNSAATDAALQTYQPAPNLVPGAWHRFTIDVKGNTYTVDLTDVAGGTTTRTTTFKNTDAVRGVAKESGRPIGYVGLQSYPGSPVAFRRIQIKP